MERKCVKILVLSFYYNPDLSAGSFRTTALVNALKLKMPLNGQITVFTTHPNRYSSILVEALLEENIEGVSIVRIQLPRHNSGMIDQSKAFFSYAHQVIKRTKNQEFDMVFATSGRLMTAVLGAWVAHKKRVPLYLDIRDIFVDTVKDVLPKFSSKLIIPVLILLERWAINTANKVNLVSEGFTDYFSTRYPNQRFSYFTNGIDDEFLFIKSQKSDLIKSSLVKVLYAGNIGEGQGLHLIIPDLAKSMRGQVQFKIIGDGGKKDKLIAALALEGIDNVELYPPMNRQQLIEEYQAADVLFIHLNDYDAFRKVLPSKLFEYGAMGKPIWAGVSGYAADFIEHEINNAVIFQPCKADCAEVAFKRLQISHTCRTDFIEKFTRQNIAMKMASDVIKTIGLD